MSISARIIADSKNEFGNRLTTFVLTFPRIVLAEFNTHRMFTRNSASSRAIPFKTMVQSVKDNPFIPIAFQRDHSGMQGTEYFTGWREKVIRLAWITASKTAVFAATKLHKLGLTKQLCNRLLEPFLYHTVICTASEWENFFALRAHPAAEIHIADLAEKMLVAYNESTPKLLKAGEWHIPFGDQFDEERLYKLFPPVHPSSLNWEIEHLNQLKLKIAVARAARISYSNFEGKDDYEADIKLHDRLSEQGHFSPFEHCARAMSSDEYDTHFRGVLTEGRCNCGASHGYITFDDTEGEGWCGNFRGFIQYRKLLSNENRSDSRVIKK